MKRWQKNDLTATNVLARTTSSVVTPSSFFGSYTPAALSTSAAIGTVELTGLEIMLTTALGACAATATARACTMPALMLNRSSRVMPGLRGTPAGIMTRSAPERAAASSSGPVWPETCVGGREREGRKERGGKVRSGLSFCFFSAAPTAHRLRPSSLFFSMGATAAEGTLEEKEA